MKIVLGKVTEQLNARAVKAVAAATAPLPELGKWWSVRNAAGEKGAPAELDLYGEIGYYGVTAVQFNEDLRGITASKVEMRVNSPGGDVFDAMAIYNLIRSHPAHFTARVDGLAASAASVIVQAADERVMMPHAQLMIHKAWGMTVGNSDDHLDTAALLARQDSIIVDVYLERTRGGKAKREKIEKAMAAETWFTDDEAVAFGLADRVEKPAWQAEAPDDGDDEDDPAAAAGDDEDDDTDEGEDGDGPPAEDDPERAAALATLRAVMEPDDEDEELLAELEAMLA